MHAYTASIALPNGDITNRQIAAESYENARKIARRIASGLEATSVEVWR